MAVGPRRGTAHLLVELLRRRDHRIAMISVLVLIVIVLGVAIGIQTKATLG